MARKNSSRAAQGAGTIRKKTVTRSGKEYVYWEARITVGHDPGTGKQIQRSFSGKTQKGVREKMQAAAVELNNGTYQAPSKLTVGQWLDIWTAEYLGNVKQSTAFLYCQQIRLHIKPRMGSIKLEALTAPTIQSFYNSLVVERDGKPALSAKSVRNIHGILHRALQQATAIGYLRFNPADACVPPKVVNKEIAPLDEVQTGAFLKAIEGHPHELIYKVTLFTGLREGEVLGLMWDCIDFERGTVTVKRQLRKDQQKGGGYYLSTPKNGKPRTLTPAPWVMRLFKLQRAKQTEQRLKVGPMWQDSGMVFTNELGGYLSYRTVYDCFKRIVAKLGIPQARFHDLRHSYAVAALLAGDDIKTVQDNLGHATAAFTLDVYGHVTDQMKRASADRMEQYIKRVSEA